VICKIECKKLIESCGHTCRHQCSHLKKCEEICNEIVEKKIESCGHLIRIRCCVVPTQSMCKEDCTKTLDCGHKCLKQCGVIPCGKCMTKIETKTRCEHESDVKIFCEDSINNNFWKYQSLCWSKCNKILDCGHLCSLDCYQCYSGCLHGECQQKCDRILICGHKCELNCSKQCRPCSRDCENKCIHSKCTKKCYEPCDLCVEDCSWFCDHTKCNKKCNEICDREVCDKACSKYLICNHPCIGVCGEPCPDLCRICDEKQVTEIFFGTEDEKDARFIVLEDCGHIVELSGMQAFLKAKFETKTTDEQEESKTEIQMPECPKCKKTIRTNRVFSKYVKEQLINIESVKAKYMGEKSEVSKETSKLISLVKIQDEKDEIENSKNKKFRTIFNCKCMESPFLKFLKESEKHFTLNFIISMKNYWNMTSMLSKIIKQKKLQALTSWQNEFIDFEINKLSAIIKQDQRSQFESFNYLPDQITKELINELARVEAILLYFEFEFLFNTRKDEIDIKRDLITDTLSKLENKLYKTTIVPFNRIEDEIKSYFEVLNKEFKTKMTQHDKLMIYQAMEFRQGHWYKCPNGHTYCITECGQAMELAACPDCGAAIGGNNHRLLTTNQVDKSMKLTNDD
jgi:hypothetical protein